MSLGIPITLGAPLAVVMVGAAVAVGQFGLPFTDEPWLARARAGHVEWVKTSRIATGRIRDAGDYLTGLRALGPRPHLPDLSANRLRIKRVTVIPAAGGQPAAIHVGYTGTRGCRVSLWISRTGQNGSGLLVKHRYGNSTVSWHTGGLRYVLVASSMKQQRFDLVASVSYETTVARSTPDEGTRAALALSRAMSAPCKV